AQPPQVPKWTQRGATRSGDACSTSSVRASSKLRWRPVCCTRTRSPGSAPATNTVLPACACPSGLRATPRPSWLRSVISSSKGVCSLLALSCLLLRPVAARVLVPPARTRALDPLLREHAADLRLSLGVAVGDRDLAVDGLAVVVVVGDGVVDRDPVLER